MSSTSWNDEEDVALDYLPWEAQIIYLRGLRKRMDYSTGIVGATKKSSISRAWLIALLDVVRERGSKAESRKITVEGLRNILRCLVRAGLIEPVKNNDRRMIFFLPLASVDDSVSRRNNRGTTEEQPSSSNRDKTSSDAPLSDMNNRGTTVAAPAKNHLIQETGLQDKTISQKREAKKQKTVRGSRLSLTGLPDTWKQWAIQERPDLDPVQTWEMFRDYWTAQPGAKGSKTDWLATWRNWVRRERQQITQRGNRQSKAQAIENANDALRRSYGIGRTIEGDCDYEAG